MRMLLLLGELYYEIQLKLANHILMIFRLLNQPANEKSHCNLQIQWHICQFLLAVLSVFTSYILIHCC